MSLPININDHSYFMVRLPIHPAAQEVAESVTGQELEKVGAGETAAAETESGPGWDQVGTKSGLSRHQVEILRECLGGAEIADLMTIPDKSTSRNQRDRTTDKGRALLVTLPTVKTE